MNSALINDLLKLGLGSYEASTLSILLEESPASAAQVAKRLGLSRSSVYTTLNTLIGKGLVATTFQNDVRQFEGLGYESLEQLVKNEQAKAQEQVRTLGNLKKSLANPKRNDSLIPQAVFFEGQEGLKRAYLEMLRQAPQGGVLKLLRDEFVWQPEWSFIFSNDWKSRVARRKEERNISTQLLVNSSEIELQKSDFYASRAKTTTRHLPNHATVSSFAQYCIGDCVIILSLRKGDLSGIKITNRNLATNYSVLFDGLWEVSN